MERLLHYVWKNRLMPRSGLVTTEGLPVEVLSPGVHNKDAGPDFFCSDVVVGGEDWMGNVEIHTLSSDWYRHGHDQDKAYNNVVLHVVERADRDVFTESGRKIPQLELKVPDYVVSNYEHLQVYEDYPPCYGIADSLPAIVSHQWIGRLAEERLERKAAEIGKRLEFCESNWEQVLFITVARALGFGVNNDAFERLARGIPYFGIAKHRDNLFQIEAMMLGQAGLLDEAVMNESQKANMAADDYFNALKREYSFLANKFTLTPMNGCEWKFMRLRPQNFPTLRLAQFASLYHKQQLCLSALVDAGSVKDVVKLFETEVSPYWQRHFTLCSEETSPSLRHLSQASLDSMIINAVVPTLFAYGRYRSSKKLTDKALKFLSDLEGEDNKYTRMWRKMGLTVANARESQAALQLMTQYCLRKDCLRCQLGYQYIKRK
jgi:hypothetical protein